MFFAPFSVSNRFSVVPQAKLAELQELVMRLVSERNDWYSRYTAAVAGAGSVNPDLLPVGEDLTHQEHQAHSHTHLNADSGAGRHNRYYCMSLLHLKLMYTNSKVGRTVTYVPF